jgi:hypothetical protein
MGKIGSRLLITAFLFIEKAFFPSVSNFYTIFRLFEEVIDQEPSSTSLSNII